MKNNILKYVLMIAAVAILIPACREEQTDPVVGNMKVYLGDEQVTVGTRGKAMQFYLESDAELCAMWPGGNRQILKSKVDVTKDSIDVYGNHVLVKSDDYRDYGLFKAQGVVMTVTKSDRISNGFEAAYTFPVIKNAKGDTIKQGAIEYEIYFLATRHGYDGPDWTRTIKSFKYTVND